MTTLHKDFEEDDPYALVGQGFPCPDGYDSIGEMARTFVEEFAMLGHTRQFVMQLFKSPRYQGPHGVLMTRGEAYVQDLIADVYGPLEVVNALA